MIAVSTTHSAVALVRQKAWLSASPAIKHTRLVFYERFGELSHMGKSREKVRCFGIWIET